jgi:hypothetical protein
MATRDLTAEDVADWLTPSQAVEILNVAFQTDEYVSKQTLLGRLAAGVILAASAEAVSDETKPARRLLYGLIPADDWLRISTNDNFWISGDLSFERREYGYSNFQMVRRFGVRFEPHSVRAIIAGAAPPVKPAPQQIQVPAEAVGNKGGRPPKAWWQDFWIEMCCRVYDGDIQPESTQAAILAQMQQWVSDHDYEAGDTVLKDAAQKLSRALKSRSET